MSDKQPQPRRPSPASGKEYGSGLDWSLLDPESFAQNEAELLSKLRRQSRDD
jgi:hypothetical protein